ncbi:hypothetical protein Y032_0473g2094 [Ancylostoma ceylanicum]|uniref:Uncharacterized protein n=1 Tax=Ancylostoma ceylanicum TaxID=53326 RepID=A0A016WWW7_9BILA|nr:hypothetical protein Y032_0473g2094 [Ancylostoma ceylanicum]
MGAQLQKIFPGFTVHTWERRECELDRLCLCTNGIFRRRHERYVRHLVAKKLKSQKPLKKESSVLVRISIAEANKPGESCVQKRKSLNELFRELEISLKRAVLRNGDQEKDEESEEDML